MIKNGEYSGDREPAVMSVIYSLNILICYGNIYLNTVKIYRTGWSSLTLRGGD
jgi:hypothetical protein